MSGTTLSFDQARSVVHAADIQYQEHRVAWEHLQAEPRALRVGERTFQLDDEGLGRVCSQIGAPAQYLSSLPDDLWPALLNHHFRERADTRQVASAIACGGRIIGLGRGDLARMPAEEVLSAVQEGSGRRESDLEVVNLRLGHDLFLFDIVSPIGSSEITPGDVIQAGVEIRYSPTANFATTVSAYALRVVCQNGMIQRECLGARRTPRTRRPSADNPQSSRLQHDQIRRLTMDAWSRIEQRLRGLQELTTQPADFDRVTATWLQRARLSPDRYRAALQRAWDAEGNDRTVYGVMNAFTRAANDAEIPERVRVAFARLGGLLAFQSRHLCPRCFALVAESN
jgi:hypothetical protein